MWMFILTDAVLLPTLWLKLFKCNQGVRQINMLYSCLEPYFLLSEMNLSKHDILGTILTLRKQVHCLYENDSTTQG